jgi:hypothetical protein
MGIIFEGRIMFDGTWRIKGQLYYNGQTYPKEIEFLIDSGAESTLITDNTAKKADRDLGYHALKTPEVQMGGAGSCMGRPIFKAGIVFSNKDGVTDLKLCQKICVPNPKDYRWGATNLLGRDILNQYNIRTNIKRNKVILVEP